MSRKDYIKKKRCIAGFDSPAEKERKRLADLDAWHKKIKRSETSETNLKTKK